MNKHSNMTLQPLTWPQVRERVAKVHPQLAEVIDALNPSADFPLFLASLRYGDLIVQDGKLCIQHDAVKQHLSYRSVPLSLILNNAVEVYYEMPGRIISLDVFSAGFMFGLWENLERTPPSYIKWMWNFVAGFRSVFMLPKITDLQGHQALRKAFGINAHVPRNLLDHGKIFSQIAHSSKFESDWRCEILFFGDQWIQHALNDAAWKDFYNVILKTDWRQSRAWRNKMSFDISWELFIEKLVQKNIKASPYALALSKQIILTAMGILPAFVPFAQEEEAGPFEAIQKAYLEIYKLKDYIPTLFIPHIFSLQDKQPAYYSFQQPMLLESTASHRALASLYAIMPEIALLVEEFVNVAGDCLAHVEFDYFHSEIKPDYPTILSTHYLPRRDGRFSKMLKGFGRGKFAEKGSFIRGCVRFSNYNDNA